MTIHQRGVANASAGCLRSVVKRPLTFELRFGRTDATCAATHAGKAAQARRAVGKMNAEWTVLTDAMWRGSRPCCPARRPNPASPRRTTGSSSMRCPGGSARDRPGAISRSASAFGTACSGGSASGRSRAFSSVLSTPCQRSSTSITCSLTARSSRLIRRRRE